MIENSKAYDAISDLYDFEYPHALPVETTFWAHMIERFGGPALELAVGSGRIALELSQRGHQIDGIDSSQSMLNIAKEKLKKVSNAQQGRINLYKANMESFLLNRQYGVIYAPFNAFLLLPHGKSASQCLESCQIHLRKNGRLLIDVFAMNHTDTLPDNETIKYVDRHQKSGAKIERERIYTYDPVTRSGNSLITYTLHPKDGPAFTRSYEYRLYLYTQAQLELCIQNSGFVIEEVIENYRQPESTEDSSVFVCRY